MLFLFPLTVILLVLWFITKKRIYGKIVVYFWLSLLGLFVLGTIVRLLTDKKTLEKEDYYGQYIVDRDYFSGRQSDWQYDNYRFEVRETDSIYFYLIDKEKILKTYPFKKLLKSDLVAILKYASFL
jgi:hypothetical protein